MDDRDLDGGADIAADDDESARGFTVVEMMTTVALVAVIAVVAVPSYMDYRERIRVSTAIGDIAAINAQVRLYMRDNIDPPNDLSVLGSAGKLDPWGNPYVFQPLVGIKGVPGKARKNKNLVPINTDFDLYSMGKDGKTSGPLTAKASQDDVILANDGKFIGLASDYE